MSTSTEAWPSPRQIIENLWRWINQKPDVRPNIGPYRRNTTMTENELDFHQKLKNALSPHWELWPQVSVLALVQPKTNPRTSGDWSAMNAISNRRVDWVVAVRGKPVLIIELDDRTHDARMDKIRDEMFLECGYRVLRFESAHKPSAVELRGALCRQIGYR